MDMALPAVMLTRNDDQHDVDVGSLIEGALSRAPVLTRLRDFQWRGVRRALELKGRCLLADEMGCGKTPQALAVLAAYNIWPALVVCPACLRLTWAEEIEKWLPGLLQPRHIHIMYSSNDMLGPEFKSELRVCIVSYTMARLLFQNLRRRSWRVAVVDESHNLRSRGSTISAATSAILELLRPLDRLLLLSGTPSRSSFLDIFTQADLLCPGLLGDFEVFAKDYDEPGLSKMGYLDRGKRCRRPWQLGLLMVENLMVRRRKKEVLEDLPPKRRRVMRLALSKQHIGYLSEAELEAKTLQERCGLLKLVASQSWLREKLEQCVGMGQKVVLFAHHLRVLDRICSLAQGIGCSFFRIDGSTPAVTRQALLARFQTASTSPLLAVIGITACAVGVDLSKASFCVFLELPPDAAWLCQAEDRLHRRGQRQAVDVLMLCADREEQTPKRAKRNESARKAGKDWEGDVAQCCQVDRQRWLGLSGRLREVAALHDGPAMMLGSAAHSSMAALDGDPADSESESPQFAFEMSPHTLRLHPFRHDTGRPLAMSLRPEEGSEDQELFRELSLRESERLLQQAWDFQKAWKSLTPLQQKMARGRPYRAEDLQAEHFQVRPIAALSTRRFLHPHPAGEEEQCEVFVHYETGRLSGQTVRFLQPTSSSLGLGTPVLLCMECRLPLPMSLELAESWSGEGTSLRVHRKSESGEGEMFCGGPCRARYFGKRSGASLRRQLFELERGVCQRCGLDCHGLWQNLKSSNSSWLEELQKQNRMAAESKSAQSAAMHTLLSYLTRFDSESPDDFNLTEGSLWQADHILPVWQGGGACGLENLQTLCASCHNLKTSEETKQRAAKARAARARAAGSRWPAGRLRSGSSSGFWAVALKGKQDLSKDSPELTKKLATCTRHRREAARRCECWAVPRLSLFCVVDFRAKSRSFESRIGCVSRGLLAVVRAAVRNRTLVVLLSQPRECFGFVFGHERERRELQADALGAPKLKAFSSISLTSMMFYRGAEFVRDSRVGSSSGPILRHDVQDVRHRPGAFAAAAASPAVGARSAALRILSLKGTELEAMPVLTSVAPSWTISEAALFVLTDGIFDPQDRVPHRPAHGEGELISVLAPTSFVRHGFHPLLYECFRHQDYEPKQLAGLQSACLKRGPGGWGTPAQALTDPSAACSGEDERVVYRHYQVADSRMDMPEGKPVTFSIGDQNVWTESGSEASASWSLGLKRNVAIQLAQGEILAHFDDDDLYASGYLTWMKQRLDKTLDKARRENETKEREEKEKQPPLHKESRLIPVAITLREWHLLDLSDMTFGFMDVERDPLIPREQRHGWLYGWGFSYMFTRACWELAPVPDVEWSEDISFYEELRRLQVPVVPVPLPPGHKAVCAHSYHAKVNTSGGEFSGALRCGEPVPEPPKAFKELLPFAKVATESALQRRSADLATGEKQGFRVSLSEKKEFLQCRGQAWFAYQQQSAERKGTMRGQAKSIATWPTSPTLPS
ncbi:smrc-1 [Symbiodinium sp. CCMP2456]|nr:smrc-1 [Symbiodinium sp. CCMP2456]